MIADKNGSNGNGAAKLILRDRVLKTDLLKEIRLSPYGTSSMI